MVKIKNNIHLYNDFLTKDECEKTLNALLAYAERDADFWKAISFYESYSSGYPEDNDPILKEYDLPNNWFSDLENRFKLAASKVANVPVEKMSKISFHVQRWLPGAFAPLHSDNSDSEGNQGAFTRSRYAGFLYLNDNFEGGLLKFQSDFGKNNIDINPETGMFVIFHGGHENMHEVSVVKSGTRYTIGSFWDDREEEDYPQELREAWAKELAEVRAIQKDQQKDWNEIKNKGYRLAPDWTEYKIEELDAE